MEFKIIDLFTNYLKNKMLALIVLGISLILGYYYIFNVYEPEYIAQTTIMLGANNNTTDIGFNQSVVKNYLELVDSKNVLEKTLSKTDLEYSKAELKSMINAYFEEDTEFITIEVTSKDEEHAAKLSYGLYEGLVSEVERIFKINNIHLVDTDTAGDVKYSDNLLVCVVLFISFVLSFCSTTINYLFFPTFNLQIRVNSLKRTLLESIKEKKQTKELLKQEVKKKDTKVIKNTSKKVEKKEDKKETQKKPTKKNKKKNNTTKKQASKK